jgi:SAM-dependent methyltransferase
MRVFGVDSSPQRIAAARLEARKLGSPAEFAVQEVDAANFPSGPWAGICVCHFLDRGLFNEISRHLLPGAVLVYKTHLAHPLRSPLRRPRRSEFLLLPGELLAALPGFVPLRYAEWMDGEGGAYAGLVARRYYSS